MTCRQQKYMFQAQGYTSKTSKFYGHHHELVDRYTKSISQLATYIFLEIPTPFQYAGFGALFTWCSVRIVQRNVHQAVKIKGQIARIDQMFTGSQILIWNAVFQHQNQRVFGIQWGRELIPSFQSSYYMSIFHWYLLPILSFPYCDLFIEYVTWLP